MSDDGVGGDASRGLAGALAWLTGTRLLVNTLARFVFPFLPAIARGLGISLEQAGLLLSIRNLAGAAAPASVGLGARGGARRVAVFGVVLLIAGALLVSLNAGIVVAVIGFLLLGLGKPTFDVGQQTYLSDRTPYAKRARYLSTVELTWAGGLLLGGPLAGWLISRWDWRAPFLVMAVALAASLLLTRRVLEAGPPRAAGKRSNLALTRPALALLVVAGLFSMGTEVVFVVFGAWLEDDFALSLLALGGVSTVIGVAELGGEGLTVGFTDRLGKRRAVALGLGIASASFGALAFASSVFGLGVGLLALALFGYEITIVSAIPLASEVDPTDRSRYLALLVVAVSIGRAIGAGVGPSLFGWAGFGANAATGALLMLLSLALLLTLVPEPDHAPT